MLPTPGDPALVEQERLDRRARPARELAQALDREVLVEGLDPQPQGEERLECRLAEHQLSRAESPRVDEAHVVTVVEYEADARVERVRLGVVEQGARHPQVDEQEDLVLELPDQVLATAPEAFHGAPLDRIGELPRGQRFTPARVADLERSSTRPSTRGASWRRIVSTSGSSGTASGTKGVPGSSGASRPVSQRRALAPTSASGPS